MSELRTRVRGSTLDNLTNPAIVYLATEEATCPVIIVPRQIPLCGDNSQDGFIVGTVKTRIHYNGLKKKCQGGRIISMLIDCITRSVLFIIAMLSILVGLFLTVKATLTGGIPMPLEMIGAIIVLYANGVYCALLTFKS